MSKNKKIRIHKFSFHPILFKNFKFIKCCFHVKKGFYGGFFGIFKVFQGKNKLKLRFLESKDLYSYFHPLKKPQFESKNDVSCVFFFIKKNRTNHVSSTN